MENAILQPALFIKQFISILFYPLTIFYHLFTKIYYILFWFQYYISGLCSSLIKDGYGCQIMNPSFVFLYIFPTFFQLLILVYLFVYIKLYFGNNLKVN